jgi:hypothetical protein
MPVDARIALAGTPQDYNAFGAYNTSRAAAQTARANQMTMQAAQATADLNRNAMAAAQTLDPTDQASMRAYAMRYGPAAAPILESLTGVDNMFSARNTDRRAEDKAATDQSAAYMAQLPQFAAQLLGDASPPVLARVRAQWESSGFPPAVFDALAARLSDLPPEQQQQAIQSYLLTTTGGKTAVDTLYPARELINTGGTQVPVNLSPLARDPVTGATVPVTGALRNTADPRAPQIIQTSGGFGSVTPGETGFTPVTSPDGAPVMPYQAPSRTGNGQTQEAADLARARATEIMRDSATTMRGALTTLRDEGFLRSSRDNAVTGAGQFIRDAIPGGRGLALSMNPTADAAAQVIEGTRSTMVGQLKDMYGTSSKAMDAVRELELALAQFGAEGGNYDAGVALLGDLERRLDLIDRLYREDTGTAPAGGGASLPPVGEEGTRVRNRSTGAIMVSRGGRWVPE